MKQLSTVATSISCSSTLAIDALSKQMKADGYDIISFATGEPDFDTPENIKEAGIEAIETGQTKYTPAAGVRSVRKAAAKRLKIDCGLDYHTSEIVIASGAKHCLYIALNVLLNPGDEVIIPAPYWVSYHEMVTIAGGIPVTIYAEESQSFKISPEQLEAAITDKTKVLMLNNPSNPTGMIYSREELQALADVCMKYDLYVMSDEIYYGLVYDDKPFVSFASLSEEIKEHTILINGVSKSYAMTGWRIGYAAANQQIANAMSNYLSHSTGAPATISQIAAAEALGGPQAGIEKMRKVFEIRRNYIVERMNAIDGVSCIMPEGAFYIMMNIREILGKTFCGKVINNDDDFALAFLEKAGVALVPCSAFGAKNFVRWTYAASMENIAEGLNRLEKFLNNEYE